MYLHIHLHMFTYTYKHQIAIHSLKYFTMTIINKLLFIHVMQGSIWVFKITLKVCFYIIMYFHKVPMVIFIICFKWRWTSKLSSLFNCCAASEIIYPCFYVNCRIQLSEVVKFIYNHWNRSAEQNVKINWCSNVRRAALSVLCFVYIPIPLKNIIHDVRWKPAIKLSLLGLF